MARILGRERGARLAQRLDEAAHAFAADRFQDSRRILRPIAEEAPDAADVRELLGLSYYRMGQWNQAITELEAFRALTGSTEQHPVLADCYRARKDWKSVDELWEELRLVSPHPELVIEGRIVAAGAMADRGQLIEAIRELERGWKTVANPRSYHLRRAYALADLYERSGGTAHARDLFSWIVRHDRDFADAALRIGALS